MIPNPTPTMFAFLILGVSAFFFIMLLPAFLELKKPRDAGPRRIMNETLFMPILDLEEDYRLDESAIKKILDIIMVLQNLEAHG